jgi:MoxR-like ATPase
MSLAPLFSEPTMTAAEAQRLLGALLSQLGRVIHGKDGALELVSLCCAAGGHILLEDVPGTGKTTLARALAAVLGCEHARVQCTPDLLPADITGGSVYHPAEGRFAFHPGPVFTGVLIADELNRASPRTQSALLEALSEAAVSVDGVTHPLPRPFLCIATLNPVEMHGTFPLPEASTDRFHARISLGYASLEDEVALLCGGGSLAPEALPALTDPAGVMALQQVARAVRVAPPVADYIVRLLRGSRAHPAVALGASLRAGLQLGELARARALLRGRSFVLPEDVRALAPAALPHRLVLRPQAGVEGLDAVAVVAELLHGTRLPR